MKTPIAVLVAATLVGSTIARPEFRDRIPNSRNVAGVEALGHVNTEGGGARNAFGKDFDAAGRAWTKELCEKDSDGDGQTNGQELGDPCCAWVQNSNAKVLWTTGVSAPGDATMKSDPTLWANASCASGNSSTSANEESNSTTPKSDSTTTAPSPTAKSGVASVVTLAFAASAVAVLSTILV